MEYSEVIIGSGTRSRLNRIKKLRRDESGIILSDQEIIIAAIAAYWLLVEKRAEIAAKKKGYISDDGEYAYGVQSDDPRL